MQEFWEDCIRRADSAGRHPFMLSTFPSPKVWLWWLEPWTPSCTMKQTPNGSYTLKTTEQKERSLSPITFLIDHPRLAAYLSPGFSSMRKKHLSCLSYCYFAFFSYHLPNLILINTTGLTITRLPKLSHLARLHRLVDDISWCHACWKPYKNI